MMTEPTFTLAEITELAETYESHANHNRAWSIKGKLMRIREYRAGQADGLGAAARCARELIASKMPAPRPALRLVTTEEAHG